MLRSFYKRILRSLFEVAKGWSDHDIIAFEIILSAIHVFGWKAAAAALAAYADEHDETGEIHSYLRRPSVPDEKHI